MVGAGVSGSCCGGDWKLITGPGTQGRREKEPAFVPQRPSVPGTSDHLLPGPWHHRGVERAQDSVRGPQGQAKKGPWRPRVTERVLCAWLSQLGNQDQGRKSWGIPSAWEAVVPFNKEQISFPASKVLPQISRRQARPVRVRECSSGTDLARCWPARLLSCCSWPEPSYASPWPSLAASQVQ